MIGLYFLTFIFNTMPNNPPWGITIISILFAAFFVLETQGASTPVTWTSHSYFVTGKYTFTSPAIGLNLNQMVTIPYGSILSSTPTRPVALGLVDYNFKYTLSYYYFVLVLNSYSQTGVTAQIICTQDTDLVTLVISYLTVDPSFTFPFSVNYFTTSSSPPTAGPFSLTYYINFTASTGVTLDLTHENGMLAFQHIMDADSSDNCYNIDIVFQIFNASFYEVIISTECSTMRLYRFGFSRIIFDKTAIQALGYCYFQFGQLRATNGNESPLTFTTNPFFANNFMLGMKSFSVSGLNRFKFRCNIGTTTTVSNTDKYNYLSFMYWSFRWRVCPTGYPYFQPVTQLCYDACPNGFYPNVSIQLCQPCYYACTTCSSYLVCTNCNPLTNRYLNGTLCLPNSGYFDNGTINAVQCSTVMTNCLECIDNITCTTCQTSFFFDAAAYTCSPCPTNCTQCSASACLSCSAGYFLDPTATYCDTCSSLISNCLSCASTSLTTCSECAPNHTVSLNGTSCILNPCNDLNCAQCLASPSVCQACLSGYSISATGTCVIVCGDGAIGGTEQCDDGNNSDGDGCNADCTNGNNNGCPAANPYKDPITNLCTSTCPTGYYADPLNFSCIQCLYSCLSCFNNSACQSCNSSNNRQLVGTDCVPMPGFYDNSTADAVPCVSPCSQCTSVTLCVTCVGGYYLSASSCLPCSSSIPFCSQCTGNGASCTHCQPGYNLNITTGACDVIPCIDSNCLLCPDSMSFCTQCMPGFRAFNGVCQTVCGDFFKTQNQQCDDGNSAPKDGCSDFCTIEKDFTCQPHPNVTQGSACFYIGAVTVDLKYIQKIDGQNKLKIVLDLSPNDLKLWDSVDFLSIINMQSPVPIQGVEILKNPDGTVEILFQYSADIQGQKININVNPANSGLPQLSRAPPSANAIVIEPNDNEGAYFYDQSTYRTAETVSVLSTAVSGIALGFFVLGLVSGKMVGVQMMAVVQISFFSLLTLTHLNPCFAALSSLKLVNGYNSLNKNHLEDELNPAQPKGIFLFSRFMQNFNFTVAIIIIPLIIALITFILSKTACKNNQKVWTVFKKSLGEYTLMGLLFSGYLISVSFALQIMYGIKNTSDLVGKISLAQCSVLLIMIIGYFFFLIFKPQYFGEYTESFKKDKLSSKYYNFMLIQRVLLGSCLIFMLPVAMEGVVPAAIFLLTGVFVLVKKPYAQNYHNYRVISNMTISIIVEVIYLAFKMTKAESRNKPIFNYLPLIVCILLLICVLYNAAAIVYSIYEFIKHEKQPGIDIQKQQREQMAKFTKEQIGAPGSPTALKTSLPLNQQSITPLNLRKQIDIRYIKKEIMKINASIDQAGLANSLMLSRDNPIDQKHINQYDGI